MRNTKSDITVRQAVERRLEIVVLEDTTRERYDDLIRLYVVPTFGALSASRIDAEYQQRFYARLHRCRVLACNGKPRGGHVCKPLSSGTIRKIHYVIRGALDRAVRWHHLGVNKAAMAEAPAPRHTEPDPPTAAEAARLLNVAWRDPEWGLLLWLTMLTGPRRGEVSALRWRHLDFERGQTWVHQANAPTEAGVKEKKHQDRSAAQDCSCWARLPADEAPSPRLSSRLSSRLAPGRDRGGGRRQERPWGHKVPRRRLGAGPHARRCTMADGG